MELLFSLPFDQYQRYKIVSDIINKFRAEHQRFRILEVGAGFEETLKKFLPFDDIYCLDKEFPPDCSQKENHIPGDILKSKIHERFDFVIAIDVYEHIPEIDRKKFIDITIPLSTIATIIAAPFDQDEVSKCEFFANEVFKSSHNSDYIWLREHIENGLPSLSQTLDLVNTHHLNSIIIPNGYLPRWFDMITTFLLTEGKPELQPMMTILYELYNQNYYQYDNRNPAYRHVIVILQEDRKIDFSDLIAKEVEPAELAEINFILNSFIEKIERSYQISDDTYKQEIETKNRQLVERNAQIATQIKDLEHATATKDSQLDQMSTQIHGLEHTLATKDSQLDQMSTQIHDLEHTLATKDSQLDQMSTQIHGLEHTLASKDSQLELFEQTIQRKDSEIIFLNSRLSQLKIENDSLKSSISYRLLSRFQKRIIEPLFPPATERRKLYDLGIKGGRIAVSRGLSDAISEYKRYQVTQKRIEKNFQKQSNKPVTDVTIDGMKVNEIDYKQNQQDSSEHIPLSRETVSLTNNDIKFIAFYLPQFHPIPENDQWWGKGFTEWTNVTKALPQFIGHYQPHLPGELGFYDLRLPEIQKRQIELARHYGVFGFCFHYYWFNGKKLLERPLNQFIHNKEFDFPFCICWANENWTRRWDGLENDILMAQVHSPESDIEFIKDLIPILQDSRYIRIDGKPLVIVYRATLLPEPLETTNRWREYCRTSGIGEIYLVAALCFGCDDPREYGFDAAVEFPPHTMASCINITEHMQISNPHFTGRILDFAEFIKSKKYLYEVPFKLFRTASPGWDNTARRPKNASIFFGANPQLYKEWLLDISNLTQEKNSPEEQIVFINAWNEWAEGTHLEPDRKFGYGYLQATADAIKETRDSANLFKKKIIIVSHDAHLHGAQMLALHIAKVLKEQFHYEVHLLLKSGGRLEDDFKKYSMVYNLKRDYPDNHSINDLIKSLVQKGVKTAICNTVVTGNIVEILVKNNIKTISLIHELPEIIQQFKQEENARVISKFADKIVFPAEVVRLKFSSISQLDDGKCVIVPQGLYLKNPYKVKKNEARIILRKFLSISPNSRIILAVGYADSRKGVDLFVEIAKRILRTEKDVFFIWTGQRDENFVGKLDADIKRSGLDEHVRFTGIQKEIDLFYAGSDIYLMTSREDPFPSTVLETMDAGVPAIGFQDAGGFGEIITPKTGILVPYLDLDAMTNETLKLLHDHKTLAKKGEHASALIDAEYNFVDYIYRLLSLLGCRYKKVSVIVPNYNYAQYLEERLNSIVNQTYPVYEIIFLDDNSSDNSIQIARRYAEKCSIPIIISKNDKNSGSVFRQWAKGIEQARGDYIWIAETDDLCDSEFLEKIMAGFKDERVILSYCQSKQIDECGNIIDINYLKYTNDIDEHKWKENYTIDGITEISDSMSIKNTIPNVSATVFKKIDISEILDELVQFKIAGDWFFYVWLLQKGNLAFLAESHNFHRRHTKGVTLSLDKEKHFNEIVKMQDYITQRFIIEPSTIHKIIAYRYWVKDYLLNNAE